MARRGQVGRSYACTAVTSMGLQASDAGSRSPAANVGIYIHGNVAVTPVQIAETTAIKVHAGWLALDPSIEAFDII
jgi:hypothetical protein